MSQPPLFDEPIYVTRPTIPPVERVHELMQRAFERRWITNRGVVEQELEARLRARFATEELTLLSNATLALMLGLRALGASDGDGDGEVITTPFTFVATPQAIVWAGLQPVFADVTVDTLNLDPAAVAAAITPRTRAILPVHAYGVPCDVDAFEALGREHGIPVFYDAAACFGVSLRGRPVTAWGDASALSFHATKVYSTVEGGAFVARDPQVLELVSRLKKFGFDGPDDVAGLGLNAKLNEMQAAFGLAALDAIDDELAQRAELHATYRQRLADVPGLSFPSVPDDVEWNHAYCVVRVDEEAFGVDRAALVAALEERQVFPRLYFHPLVSRFPPFDALPTAGADRTPVAARAAAEIVCLPLYADLGRDRVDAICDLIRSVHDSA